MHEVLELNLLAVRGCVPDRTFVLAVEPTRSLERVSGSPDRIERENADFHEKVAAGYEQLAALFPERVVMLDGDLAPDQLAERILSDVRQLG